MRYVLLMPAISLSLFFIKHEFSNAASLHSYMDTVIITHKTDGIINEWPTSKFETDVSTDIKYAIDNDTANLYMAISVPNQGIQVKLMRMGMKLFIDLKGKKKEGRGISFPVKDEATAANDENFTTAVGIKPDDNNETQPRPQKTYDKKAMRTTMALHLTYMNVFGFGDEAHDQGLKMPGSINVAFAWDTADVMHIEYIIPLKMLDNPSSLNQKEISVGWRINGVYPTDQPMHRSESSGGGGGGRRGRSAYGGSSKPGFDQPTHVSRETIIREQNIWTKYLFNLKG